MTRLPTPDPALAATLRRMRSERGISREALAFRSGITPGALARIEFAEAIPGWDTVRLLAIGLDLDMVELCAAVEGRCLSAVSFPY
jgi:transcriptional regulator with XRE-family HTH domain